MENEIKVRFGLDSIDERKFTITDLIPVISDPGKLELRYLVETEIIRVQEKVSVLTGVSYTMEGNTLCELVIASSFSVEPFPHIIKVDEAKKTVTFTAELVPTLLNIAFGALRGALYEKTKGTSLAAFPLPLISMQALTEMNRYKVDK